MTGAVAAAAPVLECLAVEKVFSDFWGRPRVRALHPLTLSLHRGEVLGLLGPNGAGKSTTIKLLLGLLVPTRGRVTLLGGSPLDPAVRARVGYLPEETRLHRFLDAGETLDLFLRLHGLPRAERRRRAAQLLDMVGLRGVEGRPVGEFSKGMARRIGLAVALAGDPDLVVLDEPTSGLDPLGTREIKDLVVELRRRGRTVLLSSHLLDDVEDVADRIAILFGGQLRRLGRTDELLARQDRLRVELDRPAGAAVDAAALARQVAALVPGARGVEVSTPSDRLEALFQRVVEEATAGHVATAGAAAGGPIAGFLGERAGAEVAGRGAEDGGRAAGVGGRRTEDGARETEDGGRRTEDGGRRAEDGGRRTEDGGRETEDGGRRAEDGGRRAEDGGRRTERGAPGPGVGAPRTDVRPPVPTDAGLAALAERPGPAVPVAPAPTADPARVQAVVAALAPASAPGAPPPSDLRPPPPALRPPTSDVRPPPSDLRPPPSDARPPTSDLRPPPSAAGEGLVALARRDPAGAAAAAAAAAAASASLSRSAATARVLSRLVRRPPGGASDASDAGDAGAAPGPEGSPG